MGGRALPRIAERRTLVIREGKAFCVKGKTKGLGWPQLVTADSATALWLALTNTDSVELIGTAHTGEKWMAVAEWRAGLKKGQNRPEWGARFWWVAPHATSSNLDQ